MVVLVGCEESQTVCKAFRAKGHQAYSCDLKPCSGGHPEWHIIADIMTVINGGMFELQNGDYVFIEKWDVGIFFPDCTYLTCSAEWAYKDGPYHQKVKAGTLVGMARRIARDKAIKFFMELWNCGIEKIGMENPVGVMSRHLRKPDQIIQPWYFGDDASKKTCLWLKHLPLLTYTNKLPGDNKTRRANQTASGQNNLSPTDNRAALRSKTYKGIAKAMADQWGTFLNKIDYENPNV